MKSVDEPHRYLVQPHIAGTRFIWANDAPLSVNLCRHVVTAIVNGIGRCARAGTSVPNGEAADLRWALREKRETAVTLTLAEMGVTPEDALLLKRILLQEKVNRWELVNQCATMARLVDTLSWALEALAEYTEVAACHATQSSAESLGLGAEGLRVPDNDLVLRRPDGALARFEIFDDAGGGNNNGKVESGLERLGIEFARDAKGRAKPGARRLAEAGDWERTARFLVVSGSTADWAADHRVYKALLLPEAVGGSREQPTTMLRVNPSFPWSE